MKKIIILILISFIGFINSSKAQIFSYTSGSISFFSKTAMEDIDAKNSAPKVLMDIAHKTIAVIADNTSFKFQNKLMEEHYNEKYVESEKYPLATFMGKVNEDIDFTKDGVYNVTVTGKLKLHGVENDRTINGTITVKNGQIQLLSKFMIKCSEHHITIPSLIGAKISDSVEATVDVILVPKK